MIQDDWTIDYSLKTITHTAGTTVYTVNQLYSWLMDVFDDAAQMDDPVPMSAQTPTAYTLINGWSIPASSYEYLTGGAINDSTNDDLWANIYTLGTIVAGTQIYIIQDGTELTQFWGTDHIDILVRVKQAGVEIASGKLLVMARDLSNSYDHFEIDCSAGGRNAVPLATAIDLNNQTDETTLSGYNDISITFGAVTKDLNNGAGAQSYDVVIDCATRPLSQVYEYLKYVTRHDSTMLLNGVEGEQYLSADGSYTEVKSAPFGTFAGGTFFGARGVWIENYDASDAKNFQLVDSTGSTQVPPNVVAVKVTGIEAGDRVLVGELTAAGGTLTGTAFIDEEATATTAQTTFTYSADVPVLVRVRKKGILPFEVESTITSTGMSVAAIRTLDSIVS
jgi:hypothetical protein